MEWIRENWFFLLIWIIFIIMHLFGHGMHGDEEEHKGHGEGSKEKENKGGHGCC